MKAEILVVGDEILGGSTQDTNSVFLARGLSDAGIELLRVTQVGDIRAHIQEVVREAVARIDVLIVTGGLGPTVDDHTKEDVAALFSDDLELDVATLQEIEERFAERGGRMPEINRKQALLPKHAEKIPNPVGSAPGIHWRRDACDIFLLPGVPDEMRAMFRDWILPRVMLDVPEDRSAESIAVHVFRCTGLSESDLAQRLHETRRSHAKVQWAFYPSLRGVDVCLRSPGENAPQLRKVVHQVRRVLQDRIFSETAGESLEEVVGTLLRRASHCLAVAESCTAGLLAHRLTNVSGSSDYFPGGFITYSDQCKQDWLAVPAAVLERHGAVSAPVAVAMARGARDCARADLGASITGVAGPTGGSQEKPVGLVFLALVDGQQAWVRKLQLTRNRHMNRELAVQAALDMMRRYESGLEIGDRVES